MFKHLQIRFQTARSLPAPYAYFYTLTARPVGTNSLQVELVVTYPDRDDIDDDELEAEGYTRNDDFSWKGQLPKTWLDTLTNLIRKTELQPLEEDALDEDDDFWNMTIETNNIRQGQPSNNDDWHYLVQELMQATYELTGKERPFELTYLDLNSRQGDTELYLTGSFAERQVTLRSLQQRREGTRTLPWTTLQQVMSKVYNHDFSTVEALTKRPKRDGRWLNLGGEEWYDVHSIPALTKLFGNL
ncbi:hypothetical protein [Spirosoma gilvum]